MHPIYRLVVWIHASAAAISMVTFWSALWLEKGSARHRRVGRLFAAAMFAMASTGGLLGAVQAAAPLSVHPPQAPLAGEALAAYTATVRAVGTSLAFIALLALSLTWFGARAVGRRFSRRVRDRAVDVAAAGLLGLVGAIAIPCAALEGWDVLDGWGIALLVMAAWQLRALLWPDAWIVEHLAGILGAGTLLNSAFAVQMAPRLLSGFEGERAFLAAIPVASVGLVGTVAACIHHGRKARRRSGDAGGRPAPPSPTGAIGVC